MDYGFAESNTTMGKIGVKTWIYKGDAELPSASGNEQSTGLL